jgi:(p)ppGpp synthase/HD superfamily hydrolase
MHSPLLEQALRTAALAHRGQTRKASEIPYITHPCAVAMVLVRAGFQDDELLAAALLHDVVEDTETTLSDLQNQFPPRVCELVAALTEDKKDASGNERPWRVRKEEHLAHLRHAGADALALALADKLHNLATMVFDLEIDRTAWKRFKSKPEEAIWYYRAVADLANHNAADDERVQQLAAEVRRLVDAVDSMQPAGTQI